MTLRALDTTPDARVAQQSALARLGPEGRLRAALEMSESVRRIRLAGLRSRHPDASHDELVARFIAEAHEVRVDPGG